MNGIDYNILGQKIIIWQLLDFDATNVLKDTLDKSFKPTVEWNISNYKLQHTRTKKHGDV